MKNGFFGSIVYLENVWSLFISGCLSMNNVQFPEGVSGQWIYLKRLKNRQDMSVLLRRSFLVPEDLGGDPVLMVSANTSYQLFINGRLAGVGPRAHQNTGTSYIDAHEIGFYLEPGNNLISFHIHRCNDLNRGDFSRTPGMWCQLECGGKTLLQSDTSWEIMALEDFNLPRPRVSSGGRFSTFTIGVFRKLIKDRRSCFHAVF